MTIAFAVIMGLFVDATDAGNDNFYSHITLMDKVSLKIHQNYVKEIDSEKLIDHGINGMIDILDPHSTFFKKKQYEELRIHTKGKFGGLGIQISIRDNVLTIMTPIPGTPAARAGLRSGDKIIKIEGKKTKGIELDQAVNILRGEPGSKVDITIKRTGIEKPVSYTITREIINIKAVPYSGILHDNIGYVRLNAFSQNAGSEVRTHISKLLEKDIEGLVFDLRHNPGGLLPQAIEVASAFIPKNKLVVYTRGRRAGQNKEFKNPAQAVVPGDMPVAVLVSKASASASEIVAGAIQDWDRGLIIGDTTFGKGSVQSIIPLDQDHHLKLTTAFYYTPSGRCINKPRNDIQDDEEGDSLFTERFLRDDQEEEKKEDTAQVADTSDSTNTFYTQNGRIVHGGGGIVPDTIVTQPTYTGALRSLFIKDAFFAFANYYYPILQDKNMVIDTSFEVNDKMIAQFRSFLDSIDYELKTRQQESFESFMVQAGLINDTASNVTPDSLYLSDENMEQLGNLSNQIKQMLSQELTNELNAYDHDIRKHIKQAMLVRKYGEYHEHVFRVKFDEDRQLSTALSLLSQQDMYDSFLKPQTAKNTGK